MNPLILAATRHGLSIWGSRILEVTGRASGETRRNPVNLLELDGSEYLVAARGTTQWVRNLRAGGGSLALVLGKRRDVRHADELTDGEKVLVLRSYLRRWKMEVGVFFDGVGPTSSDAELMRIAPEHPVFRLSAVDGSLRGA
jgi:deazaflavin-dependent oxidoreductase (nitroreductase family)